MILVSAVVAVGLASWYMFLTYILPEREAVDVITLVARAASTLRISTLYEDPGRVYILQFARTINEDILVYILLVADRGGSYIAINNYNVSILSSAVADVYSSANWSKLPTEVVPVSHFMYIDPESSTASYLPLSLRLVEDYVYVYRLPVNATPMLVKISVDSNEAGEEHRGLWLFVATKISDRFYTVTSQLLRVTTSS